LLDRNAQMPGRRWRGSPTIRTRRFDTLCRCWQEQPPMDPDSFTDAQQRSIGIALQLIDELIRGVRAEGMEDESLSALQAALAEIAELTGANTPRPNGNELNAKLAQMLVHAMELDSGRLRAYGELSAEAADYLDEQSRRLSELTMRLIDRTTQGQRKCD
jgi:hypothetical protein